MQLQLVLARKASGCSVCRSSGNCCNAPYRDAETLLFRRPGRKDTAACAVCRVYQQAHRGQIDERIFGKDIFENRIYLCRNDKMNDYCCILDSESGIL